MKRFSIDRFCRGALWGIATVSVTILFLLNVFYQSSVYYDAGERVTTELAPLRGLIILGCVALLTFLLILGKDYIERIHPALLFSILSLVYVAMALYLFFNIDVHLRADAGLVFHYAQEIAEGNFESVFKGGYIERYPHQVGLMLYDSLLQRIAPYPPVSFVANLAFVLGINAFTARIAYHLFHRRFVTLIAVFLSFAFLPQFFFILFAYGLIPGFFFITLAFYFALRFSRARRIRYLIPTVLGAALAVFFKQNFLIGVIAIALYLLLLLFKVQGWEKLKPLVAICLLFACMMLPTKLAISYYENKTGASLDGGSPTVLWAAMGTDPTNYSRAPGWYNGYNYDVYTRVDYDTERAAEIGWQKLSENIQTILQKPDEAFIYFSLKTVSQWCDPMFQSVWSGPLEDCGQYTHTKFLQSIYNGGRAEQVIAAFSEGVVFLILGFALLCLILKKKTLDGWELLVMFLIGGLLFHTVWEAKSQYVHAYVFSLIPLAAGGMGMLAERLKNR